MTKAIRWGILGPGGIANQFAADLKYADNAVIQAVGSRVQERAEAFARKFDIPNAHGNYAALVADPEVDIVYVATPHPQHSENVLACLEAGKPVLCEKPFTVNARETAELIDAARRSGLFLMEAMWTRFLPTMRQVRNWIEEGAIGDVKLLKADFGFKFPWTPEHRLLNKDLGGGALLDTGIYTASLASWIFGRQPERIESVARLGETGVDEWYTALFDYGGGCSASLTDAVRLPLRTEALLIGTEGNIHIPGFLGAKNATLVRPNEAEQTFADQAPGRGMMHEANEAMRCLRAGERESPIMPLDETLAIMQTLDQLRGQWGLVYEADGNCESKQG